VFDSDKDRVDSQTLNELSNESGGRTFLVREMGDGGLLRQDCKEISNELRGHYTIGFAASDSRPSYRSLRVEVPDKPKLSVWVRKGVTVGSRTESAANPEESIP
jgi:hypothetical protein